VSSSEHTLNGLPLTPLHFRDRVRAEVDLVVERSDGKGLRFLQGKLGDRLIAEVVFDTGPLTVQLDDRIWAPPVSVLVGWRCTRIRIGEAVMIYERCRDPFEECVECWNGGPAWLPPLSR